MELLTLQQAAEFLDMNPETLRRKAVAGKLPGTKIGTWRFFKEDLVQAIRSQYPNPALRGKEDECSAKSKDQVNSILASQIQADREYAALLAPKTKDSRRSTKTISRKSYGGRTG